jgi:hypothetical protein
MDIPLKVDQQRAAPLSRREMIYSINSTAFQRELKCEKARRLKEL